MALFASANAADVWLERKLRFEYAKLKAKGELRLQTVRYPSVLQHQSAEATSVATSSRQDVHMSSSTPATIGGERPGLHSDPERDVRKRQRRLSNRHFKLPRVIRLGMLTPLHRILLLTMVATFLDHMELSVPLLIK